MHPLVASNSMFTERINVITRIVENRIFLFVKLTHDIGIFLCLQEKYKHNGHTSDHSRTGTFCMVNHICNRKGILIGGLYVVMHPLCFCRCNYLTSPIIIPDRSGIIIGHISQKQETRHNRENRYSTCQILANCWWESRGGILTI